MAGMNAFNESMYQQRAANSNNSVDMVDDEIINMFNFSDEQGLRINAVVANAIHLAKAINQNVVVGSDKKDALRQLKYVVDTAKASIIRMGGR